MSNYIETNPEIWSGRKSDQELYLHEKIKCINLEKEQIPDTSKKTIAILGYACEEGVKRNQGRQGAKGGSTAIRKQLGKMPNHLEEGIHLIDVGSVLCPAANMEASQTILSKKISLLLDNNIFPIVLGGGHDMAYGHYNGIRKYVKEKSVGIINFDAHFDLRSNEKGNNSGTPFCQIAQDCKASENQFNYLCLGIRKDANDRVLFTAAQDLGVLFIENENFRLCHIKNIQKTICEFLENVDCIYLTIDLDGFSSALAPGVSAPSPMGFSPDIVLECLKPILKSKKLISFDIAEMNPAYDRDNQTAKLAASLVHFVMHNI